MGKNVAIQRFSQVSSAIESIRNQEGLAFKDVFKEPEFAELFQRHFPNFRDRVFNPVVTLLAFLQQVISSDRSCLSAVSRVNADRISSGLNPASSDTGAYCRARAKLPTQFLYELLTWLGSTVEHRVPQKWLWKGRQVKLVDGSSATIADTSANRKEFRGPVDQNGRSSRFPMIRFVTLFSLSTGCVLDVAISSFLGKFTGETNLFLKMQKYLKPGDIVVGDALFSLYHLYAVLLKRKVDLLVRAQLSHVPSLLRIRKFSKKDYWVVLQKPHRLEWMSESHYEQIPEELCLRVCKVTLYRRGFRTKNLTLITTLLDRKFASAEELGALYGLRWQAELNLKSIKSTLNMHFLKSQTPDMIRKEVLATLIAYNLVRRLMGVAAILHSLKPTQFSFKATIQTLKAYAHLWSRSPIQSNIVLQFLTQAIVRHRVGDRPGRTEPRTVKYDRSHRYAPFRRSRAAMRKGVAKERSA